MITLIAKNKRTGKTEEFTTDYLFDDKYGRFILEDKNNWEFKVKSSLGDVNKCVCKSCGDSDNDLFCASCFYIANN